MSKLILTALIAVSAATNAGAAPVPGTETVIPFVNSRGVLDWQAAGDRSLYVRGYNGHWYLVRTMNVCPHLRDAVTLGFRASGIDQLDRHGAIIAEGEHCPVDSVTVAAAPPPAGHPRRR
jgi:hypothetical protein